MSESSVAQATRLGGKSHLGASLYLLIITQDASESAVASRLADARPHFGDTQDYFVILNSEWFPQMSYNGFIAAEAHPSAKAAAAALDWWSQRVDAAWYEPRVQQVGVETSSPIPVVGVDTEP